MEESAADTITSVLKRRLQSNANTVEYKNFRTALVENAGSTRVVNSD